MVAIAPPSATSAPSWVRSRTFDTLFIGGTFLLAMAAVAATALDARLFTPILVLDLWLLGYHHVISTYLRLGFDRASLRRHRGLVTWLPVAVLAGVVAVSSLVGIWALASIYLYWQWFHYTRQSWGIARVIEQRAGDANKAVPRRVLGNDQLTKLVIYGVPLWGILHRSRQDPGTFLGAELRVLPVPGLLVDVAAVAALVVLGLWVWRMIAAARAGTRPGLHTIYLATHVAIFAVGYLIVPSIDHGWLAINIWHNAQYVFFVWHFNARAAQRQGDTAPSPVARLSDPRRVVIYLVVSLVATTVVYGTLRFTIATLVTPVIVYQTINFHHYVVDSLIWKVRSAPMTSTLGLGARTPATEPEPSSRLSRR